jgi:hypothetical protein
VSKSEASSKSAEPARVHVAKHLPFALQKKGLVLALSALLVVAGLASLALTKRK